jgi:sulfite reductase alpha subunit-like flavoprotein
MADFVNSTNGVNGVANPASRRRALILYASQTGTAEDLSLQLSTTLERLRFTTAVLPCDDLSPFSSLPTHDLVFFLVATTGQGDFPDNAKAFWKNMLRKKIPTGWLANVNVGIFCLGDSTYPKFCWAGRKVCRRLIQLGAVEVVGRGEGDQSGDEGVEGVFMHWLDKLKEVVRERWPLSDGLQEIPDDVLLPSKWVLEIADGGKPVDMNGTDVMKDLQAPRPGALLAKVTKNERVTSEDHWQDVRQFTFGLPETVAWEPGDTLSLSPKNFPQDVQLFLNLQRWEDIADRPLILKPAAHLRSDEIPRCPIPTPVKPFTLRTLLTHHLDITSIPRRSFFGLIAGLTEDEMQKERLVDFADPQWAEELWDYTTRPRRSLLEVMQEFDKVHISLDRLLDVVPKLRDRQFSIASSCLGTPKHLAVGKEPGTTVELLVAIVKYRTIIKKIRQGVCTRWLASLKPGDDISLVFQKGSLDMKREDYQKPVVMVGPGTGLAPMRTLLWHRIATPSSSPENLLIFGCRNHDKDFFFADEWKVLQEKGRLKLFAAFSRDQKQKRYVQTVIRERGKEVWKALGPEGDGTVYVCGSSGRMPQAVREALIEVFEKHGNMERDEAKAYLEGMEKRERYKQETW